MLPIKHYHTSSKRPSTPTTLLLRILNISVDGPTLWPGPSTLTPHILHTTAIGVDGLLLGANIEFGTEPIGNKYGDLPQINL